MSTVVIEHLKASELPAQWAEQLHAEPNQTFTVIIEAEQADKAKRGSAFGMWRDREDMASVAGYIRNLRQPRF